MGLVLLTGIESTDQAIFVLVFLVPVGAAIWLWGWWGDRHDHDDDDPEDDCE